MIISQNSALACPLHIQDDTCQGNLCPIQLILRRLHLLVGSDEVLWRRLIQFLWEMTLVARPLDESIAVAVSAAIS